MSAEWTSNIDSSRRGPSRRVTAAGVILLAALGGLSNPFEAAAQTPAPSQAQPSQPAAPPSVSPRSGPAPARPQASAERDNIRRAIGLYQGGRCVEALPIAKAAVERLRRDSGPPHSDQVAANNIQALCHKALGQYTEAEALYREAARLAEIVHGPESTEAAIMIDNLAGLYFEQQRIAQAEPLRRRALEIFLATTGPESINTLTSMQNVGAVLHAQGKDVEAEQLYRRALAIAEKRYRPTDPQLGRLIDNLAGAVRAQERFAEAGPLYERAIAIFEASLGPTHFDTALALQNHAILLGETGEYAKAEAQIKKAIEIHVGNYGPSHPVLVVALNSQANAYIDQRRWADAAEALRRGAKILAERRLLSGGNARREGRTEQDRSAVTHRKLVQALLHERPDDMSAIDEAFRVAQSALGSEASVAVSQMAARFASGDPRIGGVLRERQDLVEEAELRDQGLVTAAAKRADARDLGAEQESRQRIAAIGVRLREIDVVLARDFPGYAALADPQPLGLAEVQKSLRANESLMLTLDVPQIGRAPRESVVFVVTKERARVAYVPLSANDLRQAVNELRCGLDETHRLLPGCVKLYGAAKDDEELPFDLGRAHALYKAVFGGLEDMVADRHILLVASGPLAKLPFHVLVTEPPSADTTAANRYRQAAWLGRRQPITVLPSVASIEVLRSLAGTPRAAEPMLGFGNPLLTGADGLDQSAWSRTSCADTTAIKPPSTSRRMAQSPMAGTLYRGNLANVERVRRQPPLPETADELCAVAASIGAPWSAVRLAGDATEKSIKELSRSGELARHAIIHFATHGLVAGDLPGLAEPALMLTPPDRATDEDDGLLTASEITQLKLNADWVIMSACNTAAGSAGNADALSGLARSFFYAGARSLLVSHWAVNSDATVKLITGAVSQLKAEPGIGRTEALRRSMLAMIDQGGPEDAHPSSWAPFVLVGDGGATAIAVETGAIEPTPEAGPLEAAKPAGKPAARARKQQAPTKSPARSDWRSDVFRQ